MGEANRRAPRDVRVALAKEKKQQEEEARQIEEERIRKEVRERKRKSHEKYHNVCEWIENNYDILLEQEPTDISSLISEDADIKVIKINNKQLKILIADDIFKHVMVEKIYNVDEQKDEILISEIENKTKGISPSHLMLMGAMLGLSGI